MKHLFYLIPATILLLSACSQDGSSGSGSGYTLDVTINGLEPDALLLSYPVDGELHVDTVSASDGHFVFKGNREEPTQASLRLSSDVMYSDVLQLYIENGHLKITAEPGQLSEAEVTGSPTNTDNALLKEQMTAVNERLGQLMSTYQTMDQSDAEAMDSLLKAYNIIEEDRKQVVIEFASKHPASYVSGQEVLNMYMYNPDVSQFDSVYQMLDANLLQSKLGKDLAELLESAKRTDIGQVAPEFTATDVDGSPVSLSSLRGDYLLVDFWASWCGPCRQENPNLVKTYQDFKGKGFNIVGVSLDEQEDKAAWINAIAKDQLEWEQVSELKGWNSDVAKLYGIRAIPMNFLLDREGKIVAKGLRGPELREKLDEFLN